MYMILHIKEYGASTIVIIEAAARALPAFSAAKLRYNPLAWASGNHRMLWPVEGALEPRLLWQARNRLRRFDIKLGAL